MLEKGVYGFLTLLEKYFRLEVEGLEHLPKEGAALITPNHSGFMGFDAMLLSHLIRKHTGRKANVLTHYLWFINPLTAKLADHFGFIEATKENGVEMLKEQNMVVLFPEGEFGNFKPSVKAYQLREFKRGFIRMALETHAPIIPTIVLGAEESNINLSQLKLSRFIPGAVFPMPLNIIPLPARWKIIFMEPVELPFNEGTENDPELVHELATELQEKMQARIQYELQNRKSVFF